VVPVHDGHDGDLWCVTSSAGSKANCRISAQATPPLSVKQAYAYDYLFRLQNYRAFNNGQLTDRANYRCDAFDRQVWEGEYPRHRNHLAATPRRPSSPSPA
jgi:hypothetical protein